MSENGQNGEEEEEQLFELYPFLPPENRMMIVDRMTPRARCLFGGLSRLSWKEAKLSKNAIYGLSIIECWEGSLNISVSFSEDMDGFRLVFKEYENGHCMEYRGKNLKMFWKIDLDKSTPVALPALAHFKLLLKMNQNKIKYLDIKIHDETVRDIDFEIESLTNLDRLTVWDVDIRQFFPKLRRPLKDLDVNGIVNCRYLQKLEETYQISGAIRLRKSTLNYEQFLRLNARDVIIPIGKLTEQNIIHFLTSWHDKTYNGPIASCKWIFDSNFDTETVFQHVKELEGTTVELNCFTFIKQTDSGELARLVNFGTALMFITHRYEYEFHGVVFGEVLDIVEDMDSEEFEDQIEDIPIDDSDSDEDVVCLN